MSTSFSNFKEILPPKDRFWADPCVIYKNTKFYVFFEEFLNSKNKGHISVMTVDDKGHLSKPVTIIEQDYHLSYPSIFEYENELYMIHGTIHNSKSYVELFKCEDFPMKWKHYRNLIEDVPLVDTTMFYHDQKWWIFASKAEQNGASTSEELLLFFSDNPLNTNWVAHPKNPVVYDVTRARPAGQIFQKDGKIIRPAQNCYKIYGNGFSFNEITQLTENDYEEKQLDFFKPDWKNDSIGLHTFNHSHGCTVSDIRLKRRR